MAKVLTTIVHYESGYPPVTILLCSGCEQRTILHGESYVALIEDGKRVGAYPPECAPLTPDGLARICERHPKWKAPPPSLGIPTASEPARSPEPEGVTGRPGEGLAGGEEGPPPPDGEPIREEEEAPPA